MARDQLSQPPAPPAPQAQRYTRTLVSELRFHRGVDDRSRRDLDTRSKTLTLTPDHPQVARSGLVLEVVVFDKLYMVTPAELEKRAPVFAMMLEKENILLGDFIRAVVTDYREWGDSWKSLAFRLFSDRKDKPDDKDIQDLLDRLDRARLTSPLTHRKMLDVGIAQALVRADFAKLRAKLELYREEVIEQAGTNAKGAEFVRDSAWQAVHTIATVQARVAGGGTINPFTELTIRIIATAAEAVTAGSVSWAYGLAPKGDNAFFTGLRESLMGRLPDVLTDFVMRIISREIVESAASRSLRNLTLAVMRLVVRFFFEIVLLSTSGKANDAGEWQRIGETLLKTAVGELVGHFLHQQPNDPRVQQITKRVVDSVVQAMIDEAFAMHDIAKAEGKALGDVWLKRWPWAVAGLARNIALNLFEVGHDAHTARKKGGGSTAAPDVPAETPPPRPPSKLTPKVVVARAIERLHLWRTGGMRVGPITAAESQDPNGWGASNLIRAQQNALKRGAAKANVFVLIRIPGKFMRDHFGQPGKRFKPPDVKAKSSKDGRLRGLVVRPRKAIGGQPATHDDFDAALATWNKNVQGLKASGHLVREDGLLFHPEMLVRAALTREDKRAAQQAAAVLAKLAHLGAFELVSDSSTEPARAGTMSMRSAQKLLFENGHTVPEINAAFALLKKAQIGYLPDLDLASFRDKDGHTIPLGSDQLARDSEAFAVAQKNRQDFNETFNVLKTDVLVPHGSHDESKQTSKDGRETFTHGDPGRVGVVFPDGRFVPFATYDEADRAVRDFIKARDKHVSSQIGAGQTWEALEPRAVVMGKATQPTFDSRNLIDGEPLSGGLTDADLRALLDATFLERHLVVLSAASKTLFDRVWPADRQEKAIAAARSLGVRIGIDDTRENLILAVRGTEPGDALARVGNLIVELALDRASQRVWVEIHTSTRPYDTAGIAGWLGRSTGLDAHGQPELTKVLTSARGSPGEPLVAFRTRAYGRCFGGPSKKFSVMQLDDVWETKGRLRFARTELLGHPVVVFGRIELPGIEDASIVERPRVTSRDFDLTTLEGVRDALTLLQLYDGPIEGSNDAATVEAISTFQMWADLVVDGEMGPPTQRALREMLSDRLDH